MHFSPEVQGKLDRAAIQYGGSADEYVQQVVERYLDHDAWFREQVRQGISQLDRGEFLTHEEVGARIDEMFRS